MPTGSNARTLTRLLATAAVPLWIVTADHKIGYVSAAAAEWLGVEGDELINRLCTSGSAASQHPLDALAASLSPPAGLADRGEMTMMIQPNTTQGATPRTALFVRIGRDSAAFTLAIAGDFHPHEWDASFTESTAIRQQLDAWRKRYAALAVTVSAGASPAAKRLRARLQIAAKIRCHLGFFGPSGCGAEALAQRIHQLSAPGEVIVVVEGPLMDAELLEATIAPAVDVLTESPSSAATVLVRALDEMPMEAQSRLADVVTNAAGRLRLIGLCGVQPSLFCEPLALGHDTTLGGDVAPGRDASIDHAIDDAATDRIIEPRLAECVSVLSVSIEPLRTRVEDLPVLASALLDARHAAGAGPAERLSRAALDSIVAYPWPSNFWELEAAIRHAVRACAGDIVMPEHLPLAVRSYRSAELIQPEAAPVDLDAAVARYESKLIQDALVASDHNRAEAARRLGISRARLLRKIDEAKAPSQDPATRDAS